MESSRKGWVNVSLHVVEKRYSTLPPLLVLGTLKVLDYFFSRSLSPLVLYTGEKKKGRERVGGERREGEDVRTGQHQIVSR